MEKCSLYSFHSIQWISSGWCLATFFPIYLDELLSKLESTAGVGCIWNSHYAGALAYADDIALLAPSASALRTLLATCESHGSCLGLRFNPLMTHFINLRLGVSDFDNNFLFCDSSLQYFLILFCTCL